MEAGAAASASASARPAAVALWSRSPEGEIGSVRLGTFDSDPGIRPSYRIFTAYAVPWEPIPEDGTTRYPESAA